MLLKKSRGDTCLCNIPQEISWANFDVAQKNCEEFAKAEKKRNGQITIKYCIGK